MVHDTIHVLCLLLTELCLRDSKHIMKLNFEIYFNYYKHMKVEKELRTAAAADPRVLSRAAPVPSGYSFKLRQTKAKLICLFMRMLRKTIDTDAMSEGTRH